MKFDIFYRLIFLSCNVTHCAFTCSLRTFFFQDLCYLINKSSGFWRIHSESTSMCKEQDKVSEWESERVSAVTVQWLNQTHLADLSALLHSPPPRDKRHLGPTQLYTGLEQVGSIFEWGGGGGGGGRRRKRRRGRAWLQAVTLTVCIRTLSKCFHTEYCADLLWVLGSFPQWLTQTEPGRLQFNPCRDSGPHPQCLTALHKPQEGTFCTILHSAQ